MTSMLITPKNKSEMKLLSDLLRKMHVETQLISEETKEYLGLMKMMEEVNRSEKTSRESIMIKLRKK